jgi:hypothetical protein
MTNTPMLWNKASRAFVCSCESGVCRRRAIARRGLAYVVGWIAKCKLTNANCKMFVVRQASFHRSAIANLQCPFCNLQSPVGHVSHGGHADALGQSESCFRTLSREQHGSAEGHRQARLGLRDGMDCKVQIVQCKLQSGFGLT